MYVLLSGRFIRKKNKQMSSLEANLCSGNIVMLFTQAAIDFVSVTFVYSYHIFMFFDCLFNNNIMSERNIYEDLKPDMDFCIICFTCAKLWKLCHILWKTRNEFTSTAQFEEFHKCFHNLTEFFCAKYHVCLKHEQRA